MEGCKIWMESEGDGILFFWVAFWRWIAGIDLRWIYKTGIKAS